jgi:hypothetical protein
MQRCGGDRDRDRDRYVERRAVGYLSTIGLFLLYHLEILRIDRAVQPLRESGLRNDPHHV